MGGSDLDYIFVLKALKEIPFGVGRKLLIEFLQGKDAHESIKKNKLNKLENFGSLAYSEQELISLIESLENKRCIQKTPISGNKWIKVLEITKKGMDEIENPTIHKLKEAFENSDQETIITTKDKLLFKEFGEELAKYNDEQKKAIISNKAHVLCIAGAGSGKTTVLTKRIEFLVKYRSVNPGKILAITFTRKARHEMETRLDRVQGLSVQTFNSFCERILRDNNDLLYEQEMKVVTYSNKLRMLSRALSSLGIGIDKAIDIYFTYAQKRNKTQDQLASILLNDCFFIRDYFKSKNRPINKASFDKVTSEHQRAADLVYQITRYFDEYMLRKGLRDFADQLMDALKLFSSHPELIPRYEHILVDEYQDVNSTQIKLIDVLNAPNLFAVGDPRQSIYGWRGSDISYILQFQKKYDDCEVITLTRNYRSTKPIVELANHAIKHMGVADMEAANGGERDTHLLSFDSQSSEYEFVIQRLLMQDTKPSETFVLARTNRQLNELSDLMKTRGIKHIVRSDEVKRSVIAGPEDVTLATVHAIKGMEADAVYLIGASGVNFPCKGSEHPVIDMVTVDEYDKEEEEKRLFYVALSRARKSLYVTYSTKKPTRFLTETMLDMLGQNQVRLTESEPVKQQSASKNVIDRLKSWRRETALELGVPAYMILTDKTIIDLAQKLPMSKEDLEDIHGLGPTKIRRHGEDILNLIT